MRNEAIIGLADALAVYPDSTVLELPAALASREPTVWAAFFAWVEAQVPAVEDQPTYTRVVVGVDAMKQLREAEAARLKERGFEGIQLSEAIYQSDMTGSPQEQIRGRPLEGRWVLVRPLRA